MFLKFVYAFLLPRAILDPGIPLNMTGAPFRFIWTKIQLHIFDGGPFRNIFCPSETVSTFQKQFLFFPETVLAFRKQFYPSRNMFILQDKKQ